MGNLTVEMLNAIKKVGFSFEEYEHLCSPGHVYFYDQTIYTIGGAWDDTPCTDKDKQIAQEGVWLPDEADLMLWLQRKVNYNISINYIDDQQYFYGKAENTDGLSFTGSGPTLLCCLYKRIFKICRHNSKLNNDT